ncbi:MAG: ribosome maturation factor RimM [Ardenticatenaceae bacterium]|nr:MAG: ribosome maturation factor RimM [Ardenticatenaceae bacterium]
MKKKQSIPTNFDDLGFIVIGVITKPHGIRGELRIKPYTDEPNRFTWLEQVYIGANDPQPMEVEQARVHQDKVLLKLTAVTNRTDAEALRGQWLMVPEDQALPLEEGEYFLFQLKGLTVVTTDGETLGTLTEIIETGANNVFVVKGDKGELLLPDIDDVVQEIDFNNGRMLVTLLPGLIK